LDKNSSLADTSRTGHLYRTF